MEHTQSSRSLDEGLLLILDQLSCGVLVTDMHGQSVYNNRALMEFLTGTTDENVDLIEYLASLCTEPAALRALVAGDCTDAGLTLKDGRVVTVTIKPLAEKRLWQFADAARPKPDEAAAGQTSFAAIMRSLEGELRQTHQVDQILSAVLRGALELSKADSAFIGIIEEGCVLLKHSCGMYADVQEISTRHGMIGRIVRTHQAEWVPDVRQHAEYVPVIPTTRAQMIFPLFVHDALLALLNLETAEAGAFTAQMFEALEILSSRAAAALENARLHEQSAAQLRELRELNQLKTDIIRVASHDIRSPLAVVNGYLELLAEDFADTLTDEHRFFFKSMAIAIRRMQRMATDLLSLERVQSVQGKPETLVCFNDVMQTAALNIRDEARRHGHTFQALIPDRRLVVFGYESDLTEAVDNLLNNAVKYTPAGGHIVLRLHGMHDQGRDWIVLEVEDNGVGIAKSHQGRLFQPFFRIKTQDTSRVDGSGLGLYLVKKIVELHQGTVWFRSSPGQGSVFGFQIPLVKEE